MRTRPTRTVALPLLIGIAVAALKCSGSPTTPNTTSVSTTTVPGATTTVATTTIPATTTTTIGAPGTGSTFINTFGDTGWCGSPGMAPLARQLALVDGDILLAGDLAYDSGLATEFTRCFEPDFGRFKPRIWAAPGNHDYQTGNANAYFNYFGDRAGAGRTGYYAIREAGWKVLMLNSMAPIQNGTPQYEFVRQELRDSPLCTMAVIHHPFVSSGPNGPTPSLRDLWQLMYDNGVDVMIAGHDHFYERFAELDANQREVPGRGIRLFVVGTGGAMLYAKDHFQASSEVLVSDYGFLRMQLDPALYRWQFIDKNGTVRDPGLNICH